MYKKMIVLDVQIGLAMIEQLDRVTPRIGCVDHKVFDRYKFCSSKHLDTLFGLQAVHTRIVLDRCGVMRTLRGVFGSLSADVLYVSNLADCDRIDHAD